MDNQGFVVDEQLRMVGRTHGHRKDCVAVYRSGRCFCLKDNESRDAGVQIYGVNPSCRLARDSAEPKPMAFFCFGCQNPHRVAAPAESENPQPSTMPTRHEETALLGMDDVELKNIQLQFPSALRVNDGGCVETRVRTDRGDILVAVQGDRAKPAILTYHDLGLNYISFQPFFNYVDMRALLQNFCVYHVNAPGQEEGASTLPEDYVYPTMDDLTNQLNYVLAHFGIKSCVGFGVGVGAHILANFGLNHPDKVDALVLINCSSTQAGWIEWAYQKMNGRSLRARGMTQNVLDYLMWHHFGRFPEERSQDLVALYRGYFLRHVNPTNLSLLSDAYVRRADLGIDRAGYTLRVPVLNITAADSPHVDDTVVFNGRLNPNKSTWMKISDCGMVLDEQPGKLSEAFRLFLQGEGYAVLALQKLKTPTDSNSDSLEALSNNPA